MRRLALIAVALAVTADAGRFDRINSRCVGGRSDRGLACEDFAFFEFAPSNGAGMGSACACTTPTGAKGEALTFTRTGDATCSRSGLATTGIQNGDLSVCAGNQPRVEPSGGVLGLRVEGARTNEILRSQEIDNAAWTSGAVGVAAPTITANAATAPDGTVTAERLQVPLTTAAQYSYRLQTGAAASQHTASIYVRGNGTSGTMHLWAGTTPNSCVLCSYVSGSWSRCSTTTPGSATYAIGFGNDSTNAVCVAAGAALSALDVFVWQGQVESSAAYATSPIPTVASAVTRNAEAADFVLASAFAPTSGLSVASTQQVATGSVWVAGGGALSPILTTGAAGAAIGATYWWPYVGGSFVNIAADSGGVVSAGLATYNPNLALSFGTTDRFSTSHTGSAIRVCQSGTCATSGASTFGTPSFTRLKVFPATGLASSQTSSILSRVCFDPSPSRCE